MGGVFLSAGVTFYVARLVSPEVLGIYSTIISFLPLVALYSSHSSGNVVIRYLVYYNSCDTPAANEMRRWVLRTSLLRSVLISGFISLAYMSYVYVVKREFQAEYAVAPFLLIPLSLSLCMMAILRSSQRVVQALAPYNILKPAAFAILCVLVVKVGENMSVYHLINLELASLLIILLVFLLAGRDLAFSNKNERSVLVSGELVAAWRAKGLSLNKSSLSQQLLTSADVALVAFFYGAAAAGIYALGTRVSRVMLLGNKAINEYVGPEVSKAYEEQEFKRLERIGIMACRFSAVVSIGFAGSLSILYPWIKEFIGPGYEGLDTLLWVLVMAQIANSINGPVGIVMNMTDGEKVHTKINVAAVVCMAAGFGFASWFSESLLGVGIVYFCVLIGSNIAKTIYIYRKMGVLISVIGSK